MQSATAFAPATVSNVAAASTCSASRSTVRATRSRPVFDAASVVTHRRDHRRRRPAAARGGEQYRRRRGARRCSTALGDARGVALTIRKGLPLSSGLGGSAASAAAAVVAVDALLDAHAPLDTADRVRARRRAAGRRRGASRQHRARRSAAASCSCVMPHPPDIVRLPVPDGLTAVVVHPRARDRDRDGARAARRHGAAGRRDPAMGEPRRARRRAAPSGFRAASARSLEDTIAEPRRALAGPGPRRDQARGGRGWRARLRPVRIRPVAVRALPRSRRSPSGSPTAMTAAVRAHIGGDAADLHVVDRSARRPRDLTTCAS